MTESNVVYVDFRRRCRVEAMPDDPVNDRMNCKICPLTDQCFWLVKIFKRRLCPFYPFI